MAYTDLKKRLLKNTLQQAPTECWPYLGYKEKAKNGTDSYGRIWFKDRPLTTLQATYMAFFGDIPEGVRVLACPVLKDCCNPAHITLGTSSEFGDRTLEARHLQRRIKQAPKLTDFEIIDIYLSDDPVVVLAHKYDISLSYVSNIKAGRKCRNITSQVS